MKYQIIMILSLLTAICWPVQTLAVAQGNPPPRYFNI